MKNDILLAREAEMVLNSEAYKLAMKTLKDTAVRQWRECSVRDREGQLLMLQFAQVIDRFESLFVGMIESGKLAQHKIDLDSSRDESKPRQFFRKVVG